MITCETVARVQLRNIPARRRRNRLSGITAKARLRQPDAPGGSPRGDFAQITAHRRLRPVASIEHPRMSAIRSGKLKLEICPRLSESVSQFIHHPHDLQQNLVHCRLSGVRGRTNSGPSGATLRKGVKSAQSNETSQCDFRPHG